ncbi:DUF3990 domain-containing protein [Indiicoccus explosivorum]|uniref:DUF3990 domain-containing protein n=1 Tax=Indiicoccus explosivorum TaxID=1917864 RepID=UPI000B446514|nr:DUF3990 domain-containing protein [Indiicoccus explosivorum]
MFKAAAQSQLKFRFATHWYHGTFENSYDLIKAQGINVMYNSRRLLDFGPGFYLTTDKEQAKRFAVLKQRALRFNRDQKPCVISFELDPNELMEKYDGAFFHEFDKDFADFVADNRKKLGLQHSFDFVYGRVADGTELVDSTSDYVNGKISPEQYLKKIRNPKYEDDDQLSIHNQEIRDMMKLVDMNLITERG